MVRRCEYEKSGPLTLKVDHILGRYICVRALQSAQHPQYSALIGNRAFTFGCVLVIPHTSPDATSSSRFLQMCTLLRFVVTYIVMRQNHITGCLFCHLSSHHHLQQQHPCPPGTKECSAVILENPVQTI